MKICIELDEEMQELWKQTKEHLKFIFEYVYGKGIAVTDGMVFQCLLHCYEEGKDEAFQIFWADSFGEEEIESISQRKTTS